MRPVELSFLEARLREHRCEEPILEIGAGWDVEFHRMPFREAGYSSFLSHDVQQYDGPTLDFVGDICRTTAIPAETAGGCLLFNVLEHVYAPWRAADEIWRVMRPGGTLFGSVPLRTELHRHDKDYWRFCPDGIAYLLRRFRLTHLSLDGNVSLPANLLFAAVKDVSREEWEAENERVVLAPEVILGNDYTTTSGWKRWLIGQLRRRASLSIERWDGPWDSRRMRELGFERWTVIDYERDEGGADANR